MMIENSNEKKRLFYMIVLILTLITMIIGASLAYLKLVGSQKEEGTVLYTGTVKINYIDGKYVDDAELMPLTNVDYNTTQNVYRNNFAITSTGTLDQTISINMEIKNNEFKENSLKYVVYSEKGNQLATGFLPKSGTVNLANNIFLGHGETAHYTVIIWWVSTGSNQNDEMGSVISGKINAQATQIKY